MRSQGLSTAGGTKKMEGNGANEEDRSSVLTKSELIERVAQRQSQLSQKDVELAVKTMLEEMSQALATGGRI